MIYENGVIGGDITLKDIKSLSMDDIRMLEVDQHATITFHPSFFRLPHRILFNIIVLIGVIAFSIIYNPTDEWSMMYHIHEWAFTFVVGYLIIVNLKRVYDKFANTYTVNVHEVDKKTGIFVTHLISLAASEIAGVFLHQTVLEKMLGMGGIRLQVDLEEGEVRLMGITGALKMKAFMVRVIHEGSRGH